MKDLIKIGDIVCFGTQNRCRIGRVTQVNNCHKEYVIVPLKAPNRAIKRSQNEIVSGKRLTIDQENSKYAR